MVLEMKAVTMQIALTLSSYHDNQPPELGGKSQERRDKRGVCVLVSQFAKSSMHLLMTHKSSQCCAMTAPLGGSVKGTGKQVRNWKPLTEIFNIKPVQSFNCLSPLLCQKCLFIKNLCFLVLSHPRQLAAPPLHVPHV